MMKAPRAREQGFTLVELMMAVAITILLSSIVVYNLLGELPKYRLRATANKVAATLQYLKIRAVATNRIAWLKVDYSTPDSHYFTGFVDEDGSGTGSAPEYDLTRLDFPNTVGTTPCFKLPSTVNFGFPTGFTSGQGPDMTTFPGAGKFITSAGSDSTGGYFGYRPTGVPVEDPALKTTLSDPRVIYLTNILGEGYAVSTQITGRVRVYRWTSGGWK